jgi:type III secretion protein J
MPCQRLAVLLIAIASLLVGCKEVLHSKLSEQQANEVLAALNDSQIPASKSKVEDNVWQVSVDETRLGEAAAVLRNQGLPREKHVSMGELFKQDGMIPSQSAERIRYVYSLSEELGFTVKKIPGVLDARVHVVIPKNDPLANHVSPSSASIFIKHYADTNVGVLAPSIKDLVVASVEGLEHKNVALFTFAMPSPTPPIAESKQLIGIDARSLPIESLALVGMGLAGYLGFLTFRRIWRKRRSVIVNVVNEANNESGSGLLNDMSARLRKKNI